MKNLAIYLMLVSSLLFAGCLFGLIEPVATPPPVATPTPAPTTAPTAVPTAAVITATPTPDPYTNADKVNILNGRFDPAQIRVKPGTKVTWTNQDGVLHSVKSNPGAPAAFNSYN